MTLSFQEETFAQVFAEALPLLTQHWEELARNKDTIKLAIDSAAYIGAEQRGMLLIVTARRAGALVGYATYFILPKGHLHYVGTPWAESDIFWLHPSERGSGAGAQLLTFAEQKLLQRAVVVLHTKTKVEHPKAGQLLEALGHVAMETVYEKKLA